MNRPPMENTCCHHKCANGKSTREIIISDCKGQLHMIPYHDYNHWVRNKQWMAIIWTVWHNLQSLLIYWPFTWTYGFIWDWNSYIFFYLFSKKEENTCWGSSWNLFYLWTFCLDNLNQCSLLLFAPHRHLFNNEYFIKSRNSFMRFIWVFVFLVHKHLSLDGRMWLQASVVQGFL